MFLLNLLAFLGSDGGLTVFSSDFGLFHQQSDLIHLILAAFAFSQVAKRCVITSYDFIFRCLAAYLVVAQAIARHVYAHVGRRLIWVLTINRLKNGVQHGEYLDVAVIVDSCLSVGLEVERVDHVHVVEVGGSCFVSNVYRVFQWQVPDRECLIFGVSGLGTAFVLMIELAEAHCHLAAARSWSCYHNERTCGLDIVVLAEAVF